MTGGQARAHRFRLPPGWWVRQHIVQLVALGVIVVLIFACCNPPSWPTAAWQLIAHDCGTVRSNLVRVTSSDTTQIETCFAQAYQRCFAAMVTSSAIDLDYDARYRFVIEPYGFTCAVGVLWNTYGGTAFSGRSGSGYCDSVRLEADGLHVLGCQSIGNFFVPGGA